MGHHHGASSSAAAAASATAVVADGRGRGSKGRLAAGGSADTMVSLLGVAGGRYQVGRPIAAVGIAGDSVGVSPRQLSSSREGSVGGRTGRSVLSPSGEIPRLDLLRGDQAVGMES